MRCFVHLSGFLYACDCGNRKKITGSVQRTAHRGGGVEKSCKNLAFSAKMCYNI